MTRIRRARRFIATALSLGVAVCGALLLVLEKQVAEIDDEERRGE